MTDRIVLMRALADHFGTADFTLEGDDKVVMDSGEEYLVGNLSIQNQINARSRELKEWTVRKQRDSLLQLSDIDVMPDRWNAMSESDKTNWSNYRQELRDITNQQGFPNNVNWPTAP